MRQGRRHAAHCLCHQRCKAVVQLCIPAAPPASKYQSDYIKSNQMLTDKRAPAAYAKRRCKLGISINAEVLPQRPTFTQSCSACGSPALQRSRAVKRDECHIFNRPSRPTRKLMLRHKVHAAAGIKSTRQPAHSMPLQPHLLHVPDAGHALGEGHQVARLEKLGWMAGRVGQECMHRQGKQDRDAPPWGATAGYNIHHGTHSCSGTHNSARNSAGTAAEALPLPKNPAAGTAVLSGQCPHLDLHGLAAVRGHNHPPLQHVRRLCTCRYTGGRGRQAAMNAVRAVRGALLPAKPQQAAAHIMPLPPGPSHRCCRSSRGTWRPRSPTLASCARPAPVDWQGRSQKTGSLPPSTKTHH